MNKQVNLLILLFLVFIITFSYADQWAPPQLKKIYSENGLYLAEIIPSKERVKKLGNCQIYFYSMSKNKKNLLWNRNLVNDIAPVQVYISNSGKYVITMDEWHNVGELPIVIYRDRGFLNTIFKLSELVTQKEMQGEVKSVDLSNGSVRTYVERKIEISASSIWWNKNAFVFFGPKDEILFIRLGWGRIIAIDLSIGRTIEESDWNKYKKWVDLQIEKICLEKIKSSDAKDRETGALVAGQIKSPKAIPLLRNLLEDKSSYSQKTGDEPWKTVCYVRKAAVDALRLLGIEVENIVTEEKREER